MQLLGARLYSLFATILFFASAILRLFMLLFDLSGVTFIYYALIVIGVFFLLRKSYCVKMYENAFCGEKPKMKKMSLMASLGFFIEFVHKCVNVYYNFESDNGYNNLTYLLPVCLAGVFALIACFYFYIFALSYSNENYDFRNLRLMHLSATAWSGCCLLSLMSQATSFATDIDSTIKNFTFIFASCFFLRFSFEIEDNSNAKPITIFFANAFSYFGLAFLLNKIMSIIFNASALNWEENITAVSIALIVAFVLYFQKTIDNIVVTEEI